MRDMCGAGPPGRPRAGQRNARGIAARESALRLLFCRRRRSLVHVLLHAGFVAGD